jgi:hypothetical protein
MIRQRDKSIFENLLVLELATNNRLSDSQRRLPQTAPPQSSGGGDFGGAPAPAPMRRGSTPTLGGDGRSSSRAIQRSGTDVRSSKAGRKDRVSIFSKGVFGRRARPRGTLFRSLGALPPSGIALACYRPVKRKIVPCCAHVNCADPSLQHLRVNNCNRPFFAR